jgi:hypothetical protein
MECWAGLEGLGRDWLCFLVDCIWNVMAHAQEPDFVFRRNGRVHLNRQGRQFSRLLAAEVCPSAVVMLDTPCSEVVCRVLTTHSIRQFFLRFLSHTSPCAITFQLDCTSFVTSWQVEFLSGRVGASYCHNFSIFRLVYVDTWRTE